MSKDLKHRVASALARTPLFLKSLLSLTRPGRFLILTYHRVNDDAHPFFAGMPTRLFREQMRAVQECFAIRPLEELVEGAASGRLPRNAVAVTFDDGYRDNYTHAFPVLKELNIPATIYLVTEALDDQLLIWHDRVFDGMHRTEKNVVTFEARELVLTSEGDRHAALATILSVLRVQTPEEREDCVARLLADLGIHSAPERGWEKLSWHEAREMRRSGVRFGAHTLDHPILSHVGEAEARRQISRSKARIESELETAIAEFAYPNGRDTDFTAETKRILAEEGFRSAVTTIEGPNDASSDMLSLRRLGLWGKDPYLSVMRLARSRAAS